VRARRQTKRSPAALVFHCRASCAQKANQGSTFNHAILCRERARSSCRLFPSRLELAVEGFPSAYTRGSQPNRRWASRSRPCSSVRKMVPRRAEPPPFGRCSTPGASVCSRVPVHIHAHALPRWRTAASPRVPQPQRRGARAALSRYRRAIARNWPPQLRREPALFHHRQPLLASTLLPLVFPRRKIRGVAATALLPL
jgi:hypothetical protein